MIRKERIDYPALIGEVDVTFFDRRRQVIYGGGQGTIYTSTNTDAICVSISALVGE